MSELVVLLNDTLEPIGSAEKLSVHHAYTPLHLAFSCYVFNDEGKLLVTKRASTKKVWPGYWTNSVCGHPAPNESFGYAITRRVQFELGMKVADITCVLPDYRYSTPPDNGIVENEFCPVYFAKMVTTPNPNPDEVDEYKWLSWTELLEDVESHKKEYSYWCKDQLKKLSESEILKEFAALGSN